MYRRGDLGVVVLGEVFFEEGVRDRERRLGLLLRDFDLEKFDDGKIG
jgi:hypothetical protein